MYTLFFFERNKQEPDVGRMSPYGTEHTLSNHCSGLDYSCQPPSAR